MKAIDGVLAWRWMVYLLVFVAVALWFTWSLGEMPDSGDPDNDDGGVLYMFGVIVGVVFSAVVTAVVVLLGEATAYSRRRRRRREMPISPSDARQ